MVPGEGAYGAAFAAATVSRQAKPDVDGRNGFEETSFVREHKRGRGRGRIAGPFCVAYVLPGMGLGGTEKHVRELAARIDRRRFSPCVISTGGGGPLEQELEDIGVPVRILEYKGIGIRPRNARNLLPEALAFFRAFAGILRERRVAILHAYLPAANVLGAVAGAIARTPVKIVSKRALCRYKFGHPVFSAFENLANFLADAVMVNSRAVAGDVIRTERCLSGKIFLVYNGIEVPPEDEGGRPQLPPDTGFPPEADVVTYVANIREDKAHLLLVEAARRVLSTHPAARFLFVGREDREAAAVRRRIHELGLSERIVLTGPRRDVAGILRASRLVAHPGEQEGLSNAILEAMALGVPVVACRSGGNPETVADGESGRLVPEGDAGALAGAILALLGNPSLARTMGEAGRQRVRERFPVEQMIARVERTYSELLEGRPLSCRL